MKIQRTVSIWTTLAFLFSPIASLATDVKTDYDRQADFEFTSCSIISAEALGTGAGQIIGRKDWCYFRGN